MEHQDSFTVGDRDAISWYLITSKEGNTNYTPRFEADNNQKGWPVQRFDNLFVPDQARLYYNARGQWLREQAPKDTSITKLQDLSSFQNYLSEQNPTEPSQGLPNLTNI